MKKKNRVLSGLSILLIVSLIIMPFTSVKAETLQDYKNQLAKYKKEIKETDKIKCKYAIEDGAHYAVIKSEDDKILHAIIKLS